MENFNTSRDSLTDILNDLNCDEELINDDNDVNKINEEYKNNRDTSTICAVNNNDSDDNEINESNRFNIEGEIDNNETNNLLRKSLKNPDEVIVDDRVITQFLEKSNDDVCRLKLNFIKLIN